MFLIAPLVCLKDLFNIFINDIIEDLSVSCLLYADDMKIFTSIKEFGDCVRLQDNIDLSPLGAYKIAFS
jgi:hypothetical protein